MSKAIVSEFVMLVNFAFEGGPADPYALLHGDITLLVNGTTPISGPYQGLEMVKRVLVHSVAGRIESAAVRLIDSVGNGNRVGALLEITGVSKSGKVFNAARDPTGCTFGLRDGKICDINIFLDTTEIETVLFDHRFVANHGGAGYPPAEAARTAP